MRRMLMCIVLALSFCLVFASIVSAGELEDQLINAARNGDKGGVQALIEKGVNVNARNNRGETALRWAACKDIDVVRLLIEKGADVNAYDRNGFTALACAASRGNVEIVRELIEKGADVNVIGEITGETVLKLVEDKIREGKLGNNNRGDAIHIPLTTSEKEKCEEIVRMLKEAGAK